MDKLLLTVLFAGLLFVIGFATGMGNNPHKDAVDKAIVECQVSLPRDQVCTWEVVATPVEAKDE